MVSTPSHLQVNIINECNNCTMQVWMTKAFVFNDAIVNRWQTKCTKNWIKQVAAVVQILCIYGMVSIHILTEEPELDLCNFWILTFFRANSELNLT